MLETIVLVAWGLAGVVLFIMGAVELVSYLARRHRELDYHQGEIKTDTESPLPEEESLGSKKMSINPEDPPRVMIFNPVPGLDEGYSCDCCGSPLQGGKEVVWWPNPETGGVELYCPEKVDINE